jgi:hypothetical protein
LIASAARVIVHAQGNPVVITERVFVQVALEMLFATMLVDAVETALEQAEEAFRRLMVTSPRAYSFAPRLTVSCWANSTPMAG